MPTYQIEMLWTCAQCGHKGNRGLARHCDHCGHPKDDKCAEYFPDDISENNAIRDPNALKLAQAGPDWKCKFCGSLQTSTGPFCSYCGADRKTGTKPWQAKVKRVYQDTVTGEKHEQEGVIVDTFENARSVVPDEAVVERAVPAFMKDTQVGTKRTPPPAPVYEPPDPSKNAYRTAPKRKEPPRKTPTTWETDEPMPSFTTPIPWARIGIGAAVIFGLTLALWLIFRTKIVDATVSDVSWEHRVLIDRYQVWRRQGWDTDPGAFDVHNEGSRIHHYDKVVSGSHQESYQESYTCGETCTTTPRTCTSNRNGSATCTGGDRSCSPKTCSRTAYRTVTDYRDEPRYRDWFSWSVWDWGYNRTVTKTAHDFEPYWPKPEELTAVLKPGEQERQRREEQYKIVFSASDHKLYDIAPKNEQEFKLYPRGRNVRLKVGIAHGVEVLPDKS